MCDVQQLLKLDAQFSIHGLDSLRVKSIRIPSGGATPCPARKGVRTLAVVVVVFICPRDVLDRRLQATSRPAEQSSRYGVVEAASSFVYLRIDIWNRETKYGYPFEGPMHAMIVAFFSAVDLRRTCPFHLQSSISRILPMNCPLAKEARPVVVGLRSPTR